MERFTSNIETTLVPAAHEEDHTRRNTGGRVYLRNLEDFDVIVRTGGDEYIIASGTARAKTGKLCAIFVRIRAEADVEKPPEDL